MKRAISITLGEDNLLWLKGQAGANANGSVSEVIDRLVREARTAGRTDAAAIRSVVGSLDLGVGNGSLLINAAFASLADDNLVLSAAGTGGNISVAAGTPLTALSVALQATGMIQGGGNSADVTASAGDIVLLGNQGIGGGPASPLSVLTTDPTAQVTATTVTGSIYLESPGTMRLGMVDTGFVVPEKEVVANTRKGKQVMNVRPPDEACRCVPVSGDHVAIIGVVVSECDDVAGNFGAIIGMDIICRGDFAITNCGGQTWMSYRYPSIRSIDYVEEFNHQIKKSPA
jgi:hypothetical protein